MAKSGTLSEQIATAYMCPQNCGCLWRDNHDGTMSLYGPNSKSCEKCEVMPLESLIPLFNRDAGRVQGLEEAAQIVVMHECIDPIGEDGELSDHNCLEEIEAAIRKKTVYTVTGGTLTVTE